MGEKITTTDFEVEKTPPFETKACGNTIKVWFKRKFLC